MQEIFPNLVEAPSVKVVRYDTTKNEAVLSSMMDADRYGLPQTVFHNADTSGWSHTNPYASVLKKSTLWYTVLPNRFFV